MYEVKKSDTVKFLREFDIALEKIKKNFMDTYRGYCIASFNSILRETPQWSGNAVANWNFDLSVPSYRTDTDLKDLSQRDIVGRLTGTGIHEKGDPEAIAIAVSRALPAMAALRYPTPPMTVCINNASKDLDGTAYILMLETNPNNYLRTENEPGAMVANTVKWMNERHAHIFKPEAEIFSRIRPGELSNKGLL